MTITVVFDPPLPSDSPATFNTKAFTLLGDLNDWSTEANALAVEVTADEVALASAVYNASTSASNALASENAAAASLDSFDDRYLGSKASAPTLDNDGNALITGALYWDSVASAMFVRTSGGAWTALNASTGIAQAITVNSASAALTVTQTGSGNAFVVEDSASTDSTPFVIDASGNTTIGAVAGYASVKLTVVGSSSDATIQQVRNSVDTAGFDVKFVKNRAALYSSGIVVSGDQLGSLIFAGNDGANTVNAARITAEVDGTPGTNDMPGRLLFSTTADGASSPTERMRIDSAGLVTLAQGQIKFPATQNASADANTLDDYEEGLWTAGITLGGAAVGVTYSNTTGLYTKIGRQVKASCFLVLTSKGSSTGALLVTGLPFAASSAMLYAGSLRLNNVTSGVGDSALGCNVLNSGSTIILYKYSAGTSAQLTDADISNTSVFVLNVTYDI